MPCCQSLDHGPSTPSQYGYTADTPTDCIYQTLETPSNTYYGVYERDLFGLGCQQKTRFGRHNLRVQHFQFSNNTCMACFMLPTGRQRAQPTLGIGSQRVKQKPQLIAYPLSATRPDSTKRQARTGLEET